MKKVIALGVFCVLGLLLLVVFEYLSFHDGKLRIVICDVGQGDGVFIKSPQGRTILFDAGPDESILSCLSDNMPFWQKNLDLVIISHPHADHFMGLFSVLPNYTVKTYMSEKVVNRSSSFKELMKELSERGVSPRYLSKGNKISLGEGVTLRILGPSKEFTEKAVPSGEINDLKELVSLIIEIDYGSFSALLTGDSQVSGIEDAGVRDVILLQIPHHGSASGLDDQVLDIINPEVATISVGENKYGHPTEKILSLLRENKVNFYRTDQLGNITITTDGTIHWIKSER